MPPLWISMGHSLKYSAAMAEHSICHPGRPEPHGESQDGSPSLLFFQSAKSNSFSFSLDLRSEVRTPSPSSNFSESVAEVGSNFA